MDIVNVLIAGVGGQGLVLTTDIIAQAAFLAGFEVATNDVIGLSQRGGKINGSIRFGKEVPTPNVPPKSASVLLGLEELETLRFADEVIEGGTILMNRKVMYPNPVIMEKAEYPDDIEAQLEARPVKFVPIDSEEIAKEQGNIKVANTVLIGALSTLVDIPEDAFIEAIGTKVPVKTIKANLLAFQKGREIVGGSNRPLTEEDFSPKGRKEEVKLQTPKEVSAKEPHPADPVGNETEVAKAVEENPASPMNTDMPTYVCTVCGYVYDPTVGDPNNDIKEGTSFDDLPEDWTCPLCGAGKEVFEIQE